MSALRGHSCSRGTRRSALRPAARALLLGAALISFFVPSGWTSPHPIDLSGTWAALEILSDTVTFPLVGTLARTTTLVRRVEVTQTASSLSLAAMYCSTDFENGPALSTTVDQEFIRSLGSVAGEGSMDSSAAPAVFARSAITELHGVRLAHPEIDRLPTRPDDPRVFDQDGDGKPGITVHAQAFGLIVGDVYVVERFTTRLEGWLVSPDRIEGRIVGSAEQVILGATNSLFLGAVSSLANPAPDESTFVLQRIDSAWTWEDILDRRASLFGG